MANQTAPSRRGLYRTLLAGPGALGAAITVMLGMALWLPEGTGGIDQLVFPVMLFPVIWVALFLHACLDTSLKRIAIVLCALAVLNGGPIALQFSSPAPSPAETH